MYLYMEMSIDIEDVFTTTRGRIGCAFMTDRVSVKLTLVVLTRILLVLCLTADSPWARARESGFYGSTYIR